MINQSLPLDLDAYARLPISTFIYEPVTEGGVLKDFRIVYGNTAFAADWESIYHNRDFTGAYLIESHLMDDYSLTMMERFLTEEPHSFSTYLPRVNMHLHFQPLTGLPKPLQGFFLTNITDYEEQDARIHFLRNIRQMKNNAVLIRRHDDGHMETVYVSEGFAKLMECSVDDAMEMMNGAGFLMSTHPEDRPLVRSMLKRRVADDGSTSLTIQKLNARGRPIWCSVHYAFIDDFNEHYIYCTYFNVTVLKEYEERLKSAYISIGNNFYQTNEQTLGLLRVNLTRDLIEDVKGRDLYDTDSASRSYMEALRLHASHYLIENERQRFLQIFDRKSLMDSYLEGRVSASQMLYSKRKDGRSCFVNFVATLTRHPMSGEMIAFITEQECNSDKVRQTLLNKVLAQQFDMVSYLADGRYGVVIGDAARIKKGSIFPVARSGEYQNYLESQVLPVIAGDDREREAAAQALSIEAIEAQIKHREPYVVDIACEIDGETYHKRFDFYSIDPEAKFYILLKSDTTEIHMQQAERNRQLLEALDAAKQANVAKTSFLSSMSHEIRTPMNAIIGLDNIALQDKDLPARTKDHLEKIGVSAKHLLSLINDILDMSRIESGRMTLRNEEFSFSELLTQINTLISSQCQERGLRFDCVIHGETDALYIGDAMKLKQVLINILGNAVKFTEPPGTVSLSVERIAQCEHQSTLRFVIQDSGIGMDEEYLPKIFDAFSQENATTTNRYGGSGLGLAITKSIVEMMNGNIAVSSKKGEGSTFTVDVTLKNTAQKEAVSAGKLPRPQELRVLVVDDDPVACQHASLVLEEVGIGADTCLSGEEALEVIQLRHARREAYNLILVDLRMPDQDGVEVTRRIREIIGGETAIIILTAYNWMEIEEEARAAGVDSFMSKPLFAEGVLDEFARALQRRRENGTEEKQEVSLEGRRVLLAEDVEINAEIMIELLDVEGIRAERVENGQLAVERFAEKPPHYFDAILMDVRMPVMDGLTATERIRALPREDAREVPIIAMTANAFDEDVQRSLQAGMNAHLSKPVDPVHLYETLAEIIR